MQEIQHTTVEANDETSNNNHLDGVRNFAQSHQQSGQNTHKSIEQHPPFPSKIFRPPSSQKSPEHSPDRKNRDGSGPQKVKVVFRRLISRATINCVVVKIFDHLKKRKIYSLRRVDVLRIWQIFGVVFEHLLTP